MKSRKLFGYFLMIIGTIIPLYLAANMSLNILSQDKRHQEFNASYKELSSEELNKRVTEINKYNSKLKGDNLAVDPFASEDYEVEYKINKGDTLSIDLGEEKLQYKMVSREIINPAEWEKLKPENNKDMITLLTCDPFPTAQNRMLVNFERVVQEVEQTSEEDIKTETQDVKVEETKTSNINTMKYLLFAASILLSILLIVLLVKFIKILITKK